MRIGCPIAVGSAFAALCVVFLSGCVPGDAEDAASGPYERDLGKCGVEGTDPFVGRVIQPARDEGEGYISFLALYYADTRGSSQRLNLINCRAGDGLSIQLSDGFGHEPLSDHSVRTVLPPLSGPLTLEKVAKLAKQRGLGVVHQKALRDTNPKDLLDGGSELSTCACELYYPGSTANWPAAKTVN